MYITITPQKLTGNFSQSVADFVAYLEKENEGQTLEEMEHFFNSDGAEIDSKEVIAQIDHNTKKLKKVEPKFYSITVNPSSQELKKISNNSEDLKNYTREIMKDYASSFHREIHGKPVTVDNLTYFAKIEHQRTYKGTDKAVIENSVFNQKIVHLKNEIQGLKKDPEAHHALIRSKEKQILTLEKQAPHQIQGKRITQGMVKEGSQSHIHIIVSRKDKTNSFSLSPGSKYKASEVMLHGEKVKRGFDRDQFFSKAEKTFDRMFSHQRNFVETYTARKTFIKDPKKYFSLLAGLPTSEKAIAFKILGKTGAPSAVFHIPTNQAQLAIKAFQQLKKGLTLAVRSSSIGI